MCSSDLRPLAGAVEADASDVELVMRTFPADQLPCIAAAMPHLAANDPDEQFELGLDLMLAGLRARFADRSAD